MYWCISHPWMTFFLLSLFLIEAASIVSYICKTIVYIFVAKAEGRRKEQNVEQSISGNLEVCLKDKEIEDKEQ